MPATRNLDFTLGVFRTMYGKNTVQSSAFSIGVTLGFSSARLFKNAKERESSSAQPNPDGPPPQ